MNMVASTVSERVASADAAKKELARSRSTRRDARSRPARMLVGLNVEMRRRENSPTLAPGKKGQRPNVSNKNKNIYN